MRSFSAMVTVIVIFGLLAAVAVIATVRAVRVDGYRRIPTDRSRLP